MPPLILLLAATAAAPAGVEARDPRLRLDLVATDPQIVTPVGLAIDAKNRLFVLESHTHSPPRNYAGPKSDRIKVLTDDDRDGKADRVTIFADGIEDGMNLAFSPAGDLHVVTSQSVLRLDDRDSDGVCESRQKVLELIATERPYEHAALLGITFSHDGWMYVSRGNVGSARYSIRAAGGPTVNGFGDGGNVVRHLPDQTGVEEFATGFWNPFGLHFDRFGRLLCVDNDPDARGPNRLVHVIPGGDYGYKSMFGGGGNHPYQCWNGELPGTLPFIAGLGEAPCGLIDGASAALPEDYRDDVLCTVWGEHNLTRVKLSPSGASVKGQTEVLVEGGQDFRPVAIAAGRDGAVYFTDWVSREYPNHGRGRVWRLSAKPGVEVMQPRERFAPPAPHPGQAKLSKVASADAPEDLRESLLSDDPVLYGAAVASLTSLAKPRLRVPGTVALLYEDPDPRVRRAAAVALRRARYEAAEDVIGGLLADPDAGVRQAALLCAGELGLVALRAELRKSVETGDVSPALFETYLATTELLSPEFIAALRTPAGRKANELPRRLDPAVVEAFVRDESAPPALRALALTRLAHPDRPENLRVLRALVTARDTDPRLRLEAVRTLGTSAADAATELLLSVAKDNSHDPQARAEAVLALSPNPAANVRESLKSFLKDPQPAVRAEAERALRTTSPGNVPDPRRPGSLDEWHSSLASGGDAVAGRRVFFSNQVGCAKCHTVHNRGGKLGPDLSNTAQARDRRKLVGDILRPSDEFSIDYQAWHVKTKDGNTHLGLQLDLKDRGDIELFTTDGKTVHFAGADIAAYGALKRSLMPDGLEAGMTVGEFRDLLAFLESLK